MPVEEIAPGVFRDTGTGAYQSVPPESRVEDWDNTSTGAVKGPTEPTTYQSDDHEGPPTGAAVSAGEQTYTQYPDTGPTAAANKSVAKGKASKK